MAKKQTVSVSVDVDGEEIKRLIEMRVADQVSHEFEKVFVEIIRAEVTKLVDGLTRKHVEKAVADALDEGWQATNSYGEAIGPKIGLKGRIAEMLTKPVSGYSSDRTTRAEKIVSETVDAALRNEFGKELKAAQAQFRQALDAKIAESFTATIKGALGLK